MKYINGLICLLIVSLATGCGSGAADGSVDEAKSATPVTLTAPASTGPDTTVPTNPTTTATTTTVHPTNTVGVSPQPVTATKSAAGINPEHGKPGHRCDINVGAPLDSKPNPVSTPTTEPVITASKPTAAPVVVNNPVTTTSASGPNPEHGKPGHRCDINVGAPLNSKPNATTATTQPVINTQPVVNAQSVIPAKTPVINTSPVKTAPATTTAPGMNPEHGKPGHRCDITVGAPLDSKPKQ